MRVLREVVNRGWCPISIMALAVIGVIFEWEIWIVALVLGVILVIGLAVVVRSTRERELKRSFLQLW